MSPEYRSIDRWTMIALLIGKTGALGCGTLDAVDHVGVVVTGGTGGSSASTTGTGGAPCGQALTSCGGQCVDLSTDKEHCGACDKVCAPSAKCAQGACVVPAPQFLAPVNYSAQHGPEAPAVGDLDGDGALDVVIANDEGANPGSVSVLLGNGDGTLQAEVVYKGAGVNSLAVAVGDLDGDGYLDVMTANGTGIASIASSISVFPGNGDGTLGPPASFVTGGQQTSSLALADLDGDGDLDAVTSNEVSDDVSVLLERRSVRSC